MFGVDGFGRAVLIASLIGGLVTFAVTGGITLLASHQVGPAIGVGAFAALWGGPGFGGMMGAVRASSRDGH